MGMIRGGAHFELVFPHNETNKFKQKRESFFKLHRNKKNQLRSIVAHV